MFFFRKRSKRTTHARQRIVILGGGFVQNHLFQVLANLAMEASAGTDSESVRDEKVKVLKAMKTLDAGSVLRGWRVHVDGLRLEAAGVRSTPPASRPTTTSAPRTPRFTPPETWPSRRSTLTRRLRRLSWRWPTPSVGPARWVSDLVIPNYTYTDPEVGQVGITPAAAAKRGMALKVHRLDLAKVERAMTDGEADGFATLHTHNGGIVGATHVATHAGESLPLLTLAVAQKMTPASLAAVIHCYPTQVEAIQRVADQAVTS